MDCETEARRASQLLHDLRQPLGVISMAVANVKLRYQAAPEQVDETYVTAKLDAILKQVNRIEARVALELKNSSQDTSG